MFAFLTCVLLLSSTTPACPPTTLAAPQLPGGRPPAPPDPRKVAEDAKKAAENAANQAKQAITGNAPPAVTPLPPPPPKNLRGGLGKGDCALVVVSADLSGKGKDDLKALYDFAEGAGASLPGKTLGDRYAEIVVLDKGNAKRNRFFDELDRLTQHYQAIDVIVHCHGDPFELVWDDVTWDVYDTAVFADADLPRNREQDLATNCGLQIVLKTNRGTWLGADGGGGSGVLATANEPKLWEKFRLLDGNGGLLNANDPVQLASSTGHFLGAETGSGGLRCDRDEPGAGETFTLVVHGTTPLRNGVQVSLKAADGRYVTVAGNAVQATAPQVGPAEKFTVDVVKQTTQRPNVRRLSAQQRSRLRGVYETACFGASHGFGWRRLGFQFVAGARGVHTDSACSFPTFLGWWHNGYSFRECVDAANRADRNRSWDAWARKQGFSGVDSQRLVRGNGGANHTTPAR